MRVGEITKYFGSLIQIEAIAYLIYSKQLDIFIKSNVFDDFSLSNTEHFLYRRG